MAYCDEQMTKTESKKSELVDDITKMTASEVDKEKAYCDERLAKPESKKSELEDDIIKMTASEGELLFPAITVSHLKKEQRDDDTKKELLRLSLMSRSPTSTSTMTRATSR